jgi:N-acetylmuramoyl-L-alanine amidase
MMNLCGIWNIKWRMASSRVAWRWPRLAALLLALGGVALSSVLVQAAAPGRVAPEAREQAGGSPGFGATIRQVRIGTHSGYTRIVLELGAPAEWSVVEVAGGFRIIVPGVRLDESVRRIDGRGTVRSVEPTQSGGGVEVTVRCEAERCTHRRMTLSGPDRLVVDVYSSASGRETAAIPATPAAPIVAPVLRGGEAPSRPSAPASPQATAQAGSASPPASATPPPQAVARGGQADKWPEGVPLPGEDATGTTPLEPRKAAPPPPSGRQTKEAATVEREGQARPITVVLDPGHGGHDTGAIGPSGLMEKDVVLDLGLRLRRLLQERLKLRVLMTRSEDAFVPLPERTALANRVKADFFISLHVNGAGQRGAVGFETFFFSREPSDSDARASSQRENLILETNGTVGKEQESLLKMTLTDMAVTRDMKESSDLAERLLAALDKILKVDNRGVKSGPFHVLATAAMPAVLVESAFITNPREERRLQREDYRQRIAEAIFEGIAGYKARYEQRLGLGGTVSAKAGS